MVLAMRDAPAVERNKDGRVRNVSDDIVQQLRRRERSVPTVMPHNEESPEEQTLDNPEHREEQEIHCCIHVPQQVHDIVNQRYSSKITSQEEERVRQRALEAVTRDRLAQILKRKGRSLSDHREFIPIHSSGITTDHVNKKERGEKRERTK